MIQSVALVDLVILEYKPSCGSVMKQTRSILIFVICLLLTACNTMRKAATKDAASAAVILSSEEQRRYEYYYLEAIRLEQQARYDEAFEMLNHCLAISPTAPSALYKMANYYFFLNNKEKALESLQKAVALEPENYWYQQTLASYYQNNREYDKAIELFEQMQAQFPKRNGELLSALVGLYSHTGQYEKVIDALARLEGLLGKSEAISMEKSRNYLLMGNKEGAFSEIESLMAEYPENMYYRVLLAGVYIDHDRFSDAERLLRQVLAEDPDNAHAKITMTQYYRQQGDTLSYRAAVDSVLMSDNVEDEVKVKMMVQVIGEKNDSTYVLHLFDRVMQQPQRSAKMGHLCVQYMLAHHQSEASVRPVLLNMLEVEPDHVQARLQLLAFAARRGDLQEMVDICMMAIDYTPEVLDFYYYGALALYSTERYDAALEVYQKAVNQITEASNTEMVADIFAAMGDLYHKLGNPDEAYHCYDSALVYMPSNVLVLNNYAYYLSEEGRELEKAEQMSLRAIKAEPDNATYLDTYAWILYKQRRYAEAWEYIEKALSNESQPSDVLYEHAGDIQYQLGNVERALDYWNQALDIQREVEAVDERLRKKVKLKKIVE